MNESPAAGAADTAPAAQPPEDDGDDLPRARFRPKR
jgi:hypothetical protein